MSKGNIKTFPPLLIILMISIGVGFFDLVLFFIVPVAWNFVVLISNSLRS